MLSFVGGSSVLFRVPIAMGSSTKLWSKCSSSAARCSTLEPPDVAKLAETARINLAPREVEDFAPKINQVIDWFGQLQAVDLQSIEPSLRPGTLADEVSVFRLCSNRGMQEICKYLELLKQLATRSAMGPTETNLN